MKVEKNCFHDWNCNSRCKLHMISTFASVFARARMSDEWINEYAER